MLSEFKKKVEYYLTLSKAGSIGRRYFVMNAFDGTMTLFGIVLAAYISAIANANWIIHAGIGAALAIGISGFIGAYSAEEAERARGLRTLERAMLIKLGKTEIGRAARFAIFFVSMVDAIAPVITALVLLLPLFLASIGVFALSHALQLSIALAFIILFCLGVYLGMVAGRNIWIHGLRMLGGGIAVAILLLILSKLGIIAPL